MPIAAQYEVVHLKKNKGAVMNITQHYNSKAELDIVVHIDEFIDKQSRQRIVYFMQRATGIKRVNVNNDKQHLLVIGYDPARISSSMILKLVKHQQLYAQPFSGI